ncbi:MAG: rRNA maturation RNase YbeY [Pyramidobacter sp.]|nr:rRNA maturation RNase YbeY [Pyramidobacter sp.]
MQISLQFLGEHDMAEINGRYRGVPSPTDVLTFPLFETDGEFLPDSGIEPILLGDIILCPSVIRKNAAEHAVSEVSELALVIFHGMLHLLARDHDTPEKEAAMWMVQERFRDRFMADLSNSTGENAGQMKENGA